MSRSSHIQYQELGGWSTPAQPIPQEDPVRGIWKFLAGVSSHLALIGFLVISLAFGSPENPPHVNKTATVVVSAVLIGIAYSLSFCLVLLHIHDRIFLIHSVLMYVFFFFGPRMRPLYAICCPTLTSSGPCLISNLFALFNVVLNILCRNFLPMGLLETLSMSFSATFAFLYALGALWLYARDVNEGIRVESNGATILLTDEEMQRQQLQRLLEQNSPRKVLSPKAMQKTFRVNVPARLNSFMPPPREGGYYG
ncbi:hypothetical protein P175DRAFT_0431098 [Aspergillus ochraceoroseus IBT 24754]|nr:uncharacterized protein P175DRAFT_0431098 [Aspergillus ochraceoroseus IBT 24754]PTU22935.1 hypothetical protein P175DRAFT_0431098 [Aspergillus ochraceoroseus IBT 24754]